MPQLPQVFIARGFEALFLHIETLGYEVCLTPQLFLQVYPQMNVGLPGLPTTALSAWSASRCLVIHPLHPGYLSPPFLPGWMNASCLTPWLSSFHTVFLAVLVVFCF